MTFPSLLLAEGRGQSAKSKEGSEQPGKSVPKGIPFCWRSCHLSFSRVEPPPSDSSDSQPIIPSVPARKRAQLKCDIIFPKYGLLLFSKTRNDCTISVVTTSEKSRLLSWQDTSRIHSWVLRTKRLICQPGQPTRGTSRSIGI